MIKQVYQTIKKLLKNSYEGFISNLQLENIDKSKLEIKQLKARIKVLEENDINEYKSMVRQLLKDNREYNNIETVIPTIDNQLRQLQHHRHKTRRGRVII